MSLISLEEYNKRKLQIFNKLQDPQKTGIACPKCMREMVRENLSSVLDTYPPQVEISCSQCGHTAYIFC